MSDPNKFAACPFCGEQEEFLVEQLDSDASVVICQGLVDEYSACLARGPVGVQESEFEDQPGYAAAVREWNKRVSKYAEYVTTPAESVSGIAFRELRDPARWVEIRDLNALEHPEMGPHDYYPVGTKLRMPIPIQETQP